MARLTWIGEEWTGKAWRGRADKALRGEDWQGE